MKPRPGLSRQSTLLAASLIVVLALVALLRTARPELFEYGSAHPAQAASLTETPDSTPTQTPTTTLTPPAVTLGNGSVVEKLRSEGVLVLDMRDGSTVHLFAYHPLYLPLTRLTNNPWDEINPAFSPDGTRLAYAARQNGYWDLYMLELATGRQARLTDTPEYEAAPVWSPDGQWIAYERYNGRSLDIYILPVDQPGSEPIQLTDDPGIDRSPAWSPQGRAIAFVSTRSGDEEIWLAKLDDVENRFTNLSRSPQARDRYPAWTLDGSALAWASERGDDRVGGERRLAVWNPSDPEQPARLVGEGDLPAWSPDGQLLFSSVRGPNQTGLAAYFAADGRLSMPYIALPGTVYGMTWLKGPLPAWLDDKIQSPDTSTAAPLWQPILTQTIVPVERAGISPIEDVTAPQSMLHDAVDESFNLLRAQIGEEAGWDTLASLENAYVALTTPNSPSIQEDWLYTGRAFAMNPLLLSGGWMAVAREDFGGKTYWRVYLKARYQDGSMGAPLPELVWDLNARFSGDTRAYEQGGRLAQAPSGYWVDLTELSSRYGWERLPSWINWRTYYPSIRFNQLVMTGGMDWYQAMAEIYPPEALVTATPLPTHTSAVMFYSPEKDTRVGSGAPLPTVTPIPNRRPTWTPLPPQSVP